MCSRGRSEGDRDEGSKLLIERRDKVDIEQSERECGFVCVCLCVLVMNASNKTCQCGNGEEEPYTDDAERKGRVLLL